MFFRRKTYQISSDQIETFNNFFHHYLLPNQLAHGAKLVGRWVNEEKSEIMAMWEYESKEHYEKIEQKIKQTELHQMAQEKRKGFTYESQEDFMYSTGEYHIAKHIVSVAGYITNDEGEVLLVRNEHRPYTAEIPGGVMEENETLIEAVKREVLEETGANVDITGVVTVNQNLSSGNVSVTFKGKYVSGDLRVAQGETKEVYFKKLDPQKLDELITSEQLRQRTLDAMDDHTVPYQVYQSRPQYQLIDRLEAKGES
ncbi:NUDIX hydrolase [Aquisalibacillus elongatus]|uniref:ADP-ribose pyrophosphatase YjhB (NUDIX family) n=1 Tax=Aquisalibacillus elongatus TaxID=485577 RepID=A0A3N5BDI7_9BACI|nr:NUDIX hydrolase [Aquisalibacillus elongatus]RPF53400.1 ADP-ribose pyrophosphatase YjhB (NUDIX family) [Aquisalibacillus elongatus]